MRKLTRNLPIQGVVGFSGFRGEILTRGGEQFRRGIETPVRGMGGRGWAKYSVLGV